MEELTELKRWIEIGFEPQPIIQSIIGKINKLIKEQMEKETKKMNIKEIAVEIHQTNCKNGFWDDKEKKNIGEVLMLCVSELAEALEADRKGKHADTSHIDVMESKGYTWDDSKISFTTAFQQDVKDTFEDEIADTVIRLLDLSEGLGIDIEKHIRLKLEYNKTRPHKHGKKY
jgi:NTP pyrophosphatase (non-canonical NTP hydrolase)